MATLAWEELEELARMSAKGFIHCVSLMERDNQLTPLETQLLNRLKQQLENKEQQP